MAELNCIVVTPEKTTVEQSADFVALTLYDGEVGICPGHSPMIGRLGYGEMRLLSGGETHRYYVDGGFVQVAQDVVSVLTENAIAVEKLRVADAEKQLEAARGLPSHSGGLADLRSRAINQARARLRLAKTYAK